MGLDLTYVLNRLAGKSGLPEGRALDAAAARTGARLPVFWYRGTAAQSIPASVWTRLELGTKIHLDSTYFTFDDAQDRAVATFSGLYLVMIRAVFEGGSGGQRYLRTRVMGSYAGSGISYLGRVNDTYQTDDNEISETHYIDLQAGMSVGIDGYSTAATTTRAQATADELMYTQLQVIRLSDWSNPT